MKIRPGFIAVAVLLVPVLIGVAMLVYRGPEPEFTVRSSDGKASLRFRPSDLPEEVYPEAISIRAESTTEEGHLARYYLEPSGLTFDRPAVFQVELPVEEQSAGNVTEVQIPVLALMSGDGKTMENVTSTVELDAGNQKVVATGSLSHFSQMNVLSFVSARIDNPSDHIQFETFFVGIRMTQDRSQIRVPIENDPLYVAYIHEMSEWYLNSGTFYSVTRATSPEEIRDVPQSATPGVQVMDRKSFSEVRQFSCSKTGEARIGYRVMMDGRFGHFMEDRENVQTSFSIPNEDLSDQLTVKTRPFRCLAGEETIITEPTVDDDVVLDPGHDIARTAYGTFEARITPSTTRLNVGESLNVDVVITDVSDGAINALPEAQRAGYTFAWQASGVWAAAAIFDRTEVEVPDYHRMDHLGRLTFRLPLTCTSAGKGTVRFEPYIGKLVDDDPSVPPLNANAFRYVGTTVQTGEIECVAPGSESESQTEPVRLNVEPLNLFATHGIGRSSCPMPVGDLQIELHGPPGATWTVENMPAWLDIPLSGESGTVPVDFTCDITNYSTHTESAVVTFTSGDQSVDVTIEVEVQQ